MDDGFTQTQIHVEEYITNMDGTHPDGSYKDLEMINNYYF